MPTYQLRGRVLGDQWGIRKCAAQRHLERRKPFLSLLGQQDGGGT
jgi:hypothetical protein